MNFLVGKLIFPKIEWASKIKERCALQHKTTIKIKSEPLMVLKYRSQWNLLPYLLNASSST